MKTVTFRNFFLEDLPYLPSKSTSWWRYPWPARNCLNSVSDWGRKWIEIATLSMAISQESRGWRIMFSINVLMWVPCDVIFTKICRNIGISVVIQFLLYLVSPYWETGQNEKIFRMFFQSYIISLKTHELYETFLRCVGESIGWRIGEFRLLECGEKTFDIAAKLLDGCQLKRMQFRTRLLTQKYAWVWFIWHSQHPSELWQSRLIEVQWKCVNGCFSETNY